MITMLVHATPTCSKFSVKVIKLNYTKYSRMTSEYFVTYPYFGKVSIKD